jgi:hypothetical protein
MISEPQERLPAKGVSVAFGRRKEKDSGEVQGGHDTNKRGSSKQKHQDGDERRIRDQKGEKAEKAGRRTGTPNTRTGRAAMQERKQGKKGKGR